MAESIRFDFLSTGADKLAGDFKKTGDNAALAARGAKVLQDVIKSLGDKENRTAAESRLLASALKQTGDAEDRAAAKALAAEIAISRLDEAMQKNERAALEDAAANRALGDSFDRLAEKAGGPSLKGALLALTPALIPVTGGIAAGVGAIGVSFGAAAVGAGLFAKAASSVLSNASQNLQKLQALEVKVNTARTAAQKKAAQEQVNDLTKTWSAGYLDMIDALKTFKQDWTGVSQAIAVPALTAGIHALDDAIGFLGPAVKPVAALFTSWGEAIDRYFKSNAGSAEITRLATAFGRFSASQLRDLGVFIVDIGRGVFALGQDVAGHNLDFGTFGKHLDEWGAAFARWSQSAAARQDVSKFLAWLTSNGPLVSGLLKNLGSALATFAPGLSGLGQLELKLVSDFLGFLARTPKFIAQPLIETAGALLLLQKTGVLSIGIKIVGSAVKWLSGGVINIGSGATAAAEIRAAFTSGGAAAAAEIRAALAGGGTASVAGGGAAGAAAGKAAGGGFLASFRAALTPAAAGVIIGALIRSVGDTLSPAGTFAGRLNKNFQDDGHLWSTTLLHSFTFGGLEAWLTAKIGLPVGKALNDVLSGAKIWGGNLTKNVTGTFSNIGSFISGSWRKTQHDTSSIWGNITGFLSGSWHKLTGDSGSTTSGINRNFNGMSSTILGAMRRAGQASDNFRTRNLLPVLGAAGRVSGGIQGLQRVINGLHGKTFSVTVDANGYVNVNGYKISAGAYFSPHAAGGFISGGRPGRDSVPAMLMPGEVVVPTRMVRAGAVDHLRGRLPGFAAGGVVGTHGNLGLAFPQGAVSNIESDAIWATDKIASAATKAFAAYVKKQINAIQSAAAGAVGALGGPTSASAAQAQAYARSRLGAYGWSIAQMAPLIRLWNQESGWNRLARNPSSGAYGIPQALPPGKMGAAANPPTSSAAAQINWGLGYIKGRYGSPAGAWSHEVAYNWYDRGGWLKPGLTLAYNGTGRPEQVIPASGGASGIHLHLTVNGPIGSQQQLEDWYVKTANKMARTGRLTQAVRTAGR